MDRIPLHAALDDGDCGRVSAWEMKVLVLLTFDAEAACQFCVEGHFDDGSFGDERLR